MTGRPSDVEVYWHRGLRLWSVRGAPRGRVVGHVPAVALAGCRLIASESARLRCQATGRREVHAVVRGTPCDCARPAGAVRCGYSIEVPGFRRRDSGEIVTAASAVFFEEDGSCWLVP